jgi:predicted transcriptional regulator
MKKPLQLSGSAYEIMDILWENGAYPAKDIAAEMKKRRGWTKNATYSTIHRLIEKGYIQRKEPDFLCIPAVFKPDVQRNETLSFIGRLYDGSVTKLFVHMLEEKAISGQELEEIRRMLDHIPKSE